MTGWRAASRAQGGSLSYLAERGRLYGKDMAAHPGGRGRDDSGRGERREVGGSLERWPSRLLRSARRARKSRRLGAVGPLGAWLRGALWVGLGALCVVTLRDAASEEPTCQEAARRGLATVEPACREAYFAARDPDDGLVLVRALLARGDLRGAAAIAQELLLTPARPEALSALAQVALVEGRHEEAIRALEMAAEQLLRGERRREAAEVQLELGRLLLLRGQRGAAGGGGGMVPEAVTGAER